MRKLRIEEIEEHFQGRASDKWLTPDGDQAWLPYGEVLLGWSGVGAFSPLGWQEEVTPGSVGVVPCLSDGGRGAL